MATYLLQVGVGAPKPTRRKRKPSARERMHARLRAALCVCSEGTTPIPRITVSA